MAINKNFVVKNGLEVNTNQIFADSATGKVGIGSTQPTVLLDVQGGIAATDVVTDLLRVSGYATFSQAQVNNNLIVSGFSTITNELNVLGITSVSNFRVTGVSTFNENVIFDKDVRVTGFSTFVGVSTFNGSLTVAGISTFFSDIDVNGHTELDNLNVSGVSTFVGIGTFSSDLYVGGDLYVSDDIVFDEFRSRNAWVTGVGSISTLYTNAGIFTTAAITDANIVTGIVTNLSGTHLNYSGISTFGNFLDVNASVDISGNTTTNSLAVTGFATVSGQSDLQNVSISGISTLSNTLDVNASADISGNLNVGSLSVTGVVTASSFSGDGTNLDLTNNPSIGIGIGTTGGVVGYGITFIDFYGAGVSTSLYDSVAGIATIYFEGGGGGGSASIGIGSTPGEAFTGIITAGNLWYNNILGRLFIYYQDDDAAQWVDAAPFNVGIITSLVGGVSFSDGTAVSPSWYFTDDQTTGVFSPTNGELTFVSIGSSVLNINPGGINVTGVITATSFVGDLTGNATSATYATSAGIATYATSAGIATDLLGGNAGVNTTSTPTNLYVSGNAASNIVGLGTTSSNTTLDFSTGNNFSLELTSTIVLENPTGVTTGQSGIVLIQQDGVGSHVVGFGSHWDFPSSTPPTLSTGANALDALTYFVRSSTSIVTNSLIGIGTL